MRPMATGLVACALLLAAAPAQAEISAREYLVRHAGTQQGRAYLSGIAVGLGWADGALLKDRPATFCLPQAVALTSDQHIEVMQRYLYTAPELEKDYPVGYVLLMSLRAAFPCATRSHPGAKAPFVLFGVPAPGPAF